MKLSMLFYYYIDQISSFQAAIYLFYLELQIASNIVLISTTVSAFLIVLILRCISLLNYNLDIEIGRVCSLRISLLSAILIYNLYIY
jgi:hypothetical protein